MDEKDRNVILLSASSNIGTGLWTSICVAFSKIFGVESKNFKNKQLKQIYMF